MLRPRDMVTWQGLRAACQWEIARVDVTGSPTVRANVPIEKPRIVVGRPGPAEGEPYWVQMPQGVAAPRRLTQVDKRPSAPAGSVVFSAGGWSEPWSKLWSRWPGPFTLVTACHDVTIRSMAVKTLLDDGPVGRWFGVQVDTGHPRLTPMPLGIDAWMVDTLSRARVRAREDRDIAIYLNCRLNREGREDCVAYWRSRPEAVIREFDPEAVDTYADHLGRSHFVVSPPGHGWDCYRTYEAIVMGAIPIVLRRRPVSRVVDGLPVMQVNDWAECTPGRLLEEAQRCERIRQDDAWDASLRLETWVRRICAHEAVAVAS